MRRPELPLPLPLPLPLTLTLTLTLALTLTLTLPLTRCGGPTFDGVLVFDEVHKAENPVPYPCPSPPPLAPTLPGAQGQEPRARRGGAEADGDG